MCPAAIYFTGVTGDIPKIGVFFASRKGNENGGGCWLKLFSKITITVTDRGSTYIVHGW